MSSGALEVNPGSGTENVGKVLNFSGLGFLICEMGLYGTVELE